MEESQINEVPVTEVVASAPLPSEEVVNKYKRLLSMARSSLEANQVDLKEKDRYIDLQLLLKAGKIKGFRHHVVFELIPKNKHFRALTYESDFVVWDMYGNQIVEDCKAKISPEQKKKYRYDGRTEKYLIKKKLMFHVHNILIKEI